MSDTRAAVIEGESAAIYAYGVIVAQTSGSSRRRAEAAATAHRRWRDRWIEGGSVAEGAVAYDLPGSIDDKEEAEALAALVENRLVATYADFAATVDGAEREDAMRAAQQCAVRAVRWGAPTQAFPT